MMKVTEISRTPLFNGSNVRCEHFSPTLDCVMKFSLYLPPLSPDKFPVLYWLSGYDSSDETFLKECESAADAASLAGISIVVPDTFPRSRYSESDTCVGVGVYVNSTVDANWKMYDYVLNELPSVVRDNFEQINTSKASISGHSTGGHGALVLYLNNLDKYKSVSVLSPAINPLTCPQVQKAFKCFFGDVNSDWEKYNPTRLASKINLRKATIFIEQSEQFSDENKLALEKFDKACLKAGVKILLSKQSGCEDSLEFVSCYIKNHIYFHAHRMSTPDLDEEEDVEVLKCCVLVQNLHSFVTDCDLKEAFENRVVDLCFVSDEYHRFMRACILKLRSREDVDEILQNPHMMINNLKADVVPYRGRSALKSEFKDGKVKLLIENIPNDVCKNDRDVCTYVHTLIYEDVKYTTMSLHKHNDVLTRAVTVRFKNKKDRKKAKELCMNEEKDLVFTDLY